MSLLPRWLQKLLYKNTDEDDRTFASAVSQPQLSSEEIHQEQSTEFEGMAEVEEREKSTQYEFEIFPEDWDARKKWFLLTIRERQVVALVCMGYRNPDIAAVLGVGHQTILTHMQNIFYKFDLRSRGQIREALTSWRAEDWWKYHHY